MDNIGGVKLRCNGREREVPDVVQGKEEKNFFIKMREAPDSMLSKLLAANGMRAIFSAAT